jgi:hypothetical protein
MPDRPPTYLRLVSSNDVPAPSGDADTSAYPPPELAADEIDDPLTEIIETALSKTETAPENLLPDAIRTFEKLPPSPVELISSSEITDSRRVVHSGLLEVLFKRRIGPALDPTQILSAPEEILEEWKAEIEKMIENIKRGKANHESRHPNDFTGVDMHVYSPHLQNDDRLYETICNELLSERDYILMGIGLWVLHRRISESGVSFSSLRAGKKMLLGGTSTLGDFTKNDPNAANCLENAVLVKKLASMFGLRGDIYRLGFSPFAHRIWLEDGDFDTERRVSDIMWGHYRGGFFGSLDAYRGITQMDPKLKSRFKRQAQRVPRLEVWERNQPRNI